MSKPVSGSGEEFDQAEKDRAYKELMRAFDEGDVDAADKVVQRETKRRKKQQGKDSS